MDIILGIDPGSRFTGYGLIISEKSQQRCLAYGHIKIPVEKSLAEKCHYIFENLSEVIIKYKPNAVAIEKIFMHQNAQSALKLGQARGAALVAAAQYALAVTEYSPREIKQAIVGYGAADKQQMQHMIMQLLKLPKKPQTDAADALAIALCHCHRKRFVDKLAGV